VTKADFSTKGEEVHDGIGLAHAHPAQEEDEQADYETLPPECEADKYVTGHIHILDEFDGIYLSFIWDSRSLYHSRSIRTDTTWAKTVLPLCLPRCL
jgi:hypothetical protein